MPSRMIRDSILRSLTLDRLTMGAEVMFYRLMVSADDFGIFPADPPLVLSACFPRKVKTLDLRQVERWLQEIGKELVCFYRVEGKTFGHFITWAKYQRKRAQHSKYPMPTSADMCGHLSADVAREARDERRETRGESKTGRAVLLDDAFLDELRINPAYKGIDIERELHKMDAYFLTPRGRGKKKTRGFVVNWLNRIDRPMDVGNGGTLMSPRSENALKRFASREDHPHGD